MALPDSLLSRGEQYLNNIATGDGVIPDVPLSRTEQYLAKIAGHDVAIPDAPMSRTEQYLHEIAVNGGGRLSSSVQYKRIVPERIVTKDDPLSIQFDYAPKNYVLIVFMAEQQQTPIKQLQIILAMATKLNNGKFSSNSNSGWWANSAGEMGGIIGGNPLSYDDETGIVSITSSTYAKLYTGVPYDIYLIDLGNYEVENS